MKTYIRDESKLHNAPVSILYINMFIALAFIVVVTALIVSIINKYFIALYISIGMVVIMTIYSIFSDIYYNYYENVIIKFENNEIVYTYNLNKDFIPTSKNNVNITIHSIKKFKKKINKVRIYGNIIKKSPMSKPKNKKYCDIVLNNFNIAPSELINKIEEIKEINK